MDQVRVKRWELRYDDEWIGIKEDPQGHHVLYNDMVKEIERQLELQKEQIEADVEAVEEFLELIEE